MSGSSDLDQVKAANQAYYAALSARDLPAMERLWARSPNDVHVAPPIRPAIHVGWDTIKKDFETFWATVDELSVSRPEPYIQIRGTVAWVYGIEQDKIKFKDGRVRSGPNFGTSIFVKEGGNWLLAYHQAALMPDAASG